jgi:hypothetical protein
MSDDAADRREAASGFLVKGRAVKHSLSFWQSSSCAPSRAKPVVAARGDTRTIAPARLVGLRLKNEFAWGKHLVFQFDALRFAFAS